MGRFYTQAELTAAAAETYRYATADEQSVTRASDGQQIPVDHDNADFALILACGAAILPFRRWPDLAAAQSALVTEVEAKATALRISVAGTDDATKIAIYREKYDVALAALNGDAAALATLTPEATVRGQTSVELATLVKSLGDAWRAAGLAIDAASGAHKIAIAALVDLGAAESYDTRSNWPL